MELNNRLLNFINDMLTTEHETVSVAENITSGLLQFSFSQMRNASTIFKGGFTYANNGVHAPEIFNEQPDITGDSSDMPIAERMALNISRIFRSDWGIGVHGNLISDGLKTIHAHYCLSYRNEVVLSKTLELHPKTSAMSAQMYFTEFILGCLNCELKKLLVLK
ncbi:MULTISPECIES: CinA family protein [Chryseobacterium]|uniref:Nicotinamide-nucleotide amidase n=1 Tax=Chryseobacterium camelliae TaxID=1265445 RepID=A0ABU0TI68_9FLAO|nr:MULTISPECIES: CinA family protein [Chryseobacterium]MDT3406256.1 nicotinamide-nucleotide amidase [Pseudacidovorax intermedius]MDQ1095945.1 nicotinamide-nucleotide amidase [Chryseobacterium camelliae]MDQ1099881.1 nicotinamide-nucleotide amidase [Chryseobacterium sp. SORGH_AS_1048]MDR6087227.1 nicotinamide-nucleotide amidase [Chryseobacterium sp. SORGH_AS_0909]MDR6131601.1 nicotinamide-nucleotide amidase [Chryseobacterium sp. SORGH_AS_1175]